MSPRLGTDGTRVFTPKPLYEVLADGGTTVGFGWDKDLGGSAEVTLGGSKAAMLGIVVALGLETFPTASDVGDDGVDDSSAFAFVVKAAARTTEARGLTPNPVYDVRCTGVAFGGTGVALSSLVTTGIAPHSKLAT